MYRIYDNESGELLDQLPTRISLDYLRRLAEKFACGTDPDCLHIALEVLGLDADETESLLDAAMTAYLEEGDAYQAFLRVAHEVPFMEVAP